MLNCISCGTPFESKVNFCPVCGTSQNVPEPEKKAEPIVLSVKICAQCGEENDISAKFCHGCGVAIGTITASTVTRVPEITEPDSSVKPSVPTAHADKSAKPVISKKQGKAAITKESEQPGKKESKSSVLILAGSLLILAAAILIGSGVFNTPEHGTTPAAETAPAASGKGIDLNAMNEINELEKSVLAQPENLEQMLHLAHTLNDAGFYERAINYYKQYLGKKPASPEVIIDMGVCFFSLKEFDRADSIMHTALKLAPNHPIGLYNLGIVNMSKGNMPEARKWFNQVIEKHPGTPQAEQAKQILESHKN